MKRHYAERVVNRATKKSEPRRLHTTVTTARKHGRPRGRSKITTRIVFLDGATR